MTTDRLGKLLERVARDIDAKAIRGQYLGGDGSEWIRDVLEAHVGQLLRAGQAMRNAYPVVTQFDANAWDAALAILEGRDGK